jgi:hypothetical protein
MDQKMDGFMKKIKLKAVYPSFESAVRASACLWRQNFKNAKEIYCSICVDQQHTRETNFACVRIASIALTATWIDDRLAVSAASPV